jgi:hypothetical protein
VLVGLETAYSDTAAADLSFALGLAALPALHTVSVGFGGSRLELRLLGASHQVMLSTVDGTLSETVACIPGHPTRLPQRVRRSAPRYDFRARVRTLAPAAFSAEVARLRAASAGEHVLAGQFPGSADAITVLGAHRRNGRIGWWTAHAYPQTGELVLTTTTTGVSA